ncbi:endonuclease/exonuclease/phosphatase family protein [Paenibacillus aestuarii]|uniref:Endonuclease/exonuclease/phosphatase family protein n=1 Tax=Paenibacillus aestuarii TaxID=516965 RepID=A0ABW0K0Z6_9BACL|nr:endonuclease/exonuclease/phosphatase family protein [Paenibacillus aestuarii]
MKRTQRVHLTILAGLLLLLILQPSASYIGSAISNNHSLPANVPATPASFTIMTFNIHHGEGLDGKVNLYRIADLLKQQHADVIALQEVDRYRLRSGFVDQAGELAALLGMHVVFSPSLTYSIGEYGNAILSRYPIELTSRTPLPGDQEPRSLLTATIRIGNADIQIANTHLGLSAHDRSVQLTACAQTLTGIQGPLVIVGDFNTPSAPQQLAARLHAVQPLALGSGMGSTFDGGGAIDSIISSLPALQPAWTVRSEASDHYPVVARLQLGSVLRV